MNPVRARKIRKYVNSILSDLPHDVQVSAYRKCKRYWTRHKALPSALTLASFGMQHRGRS